MTISLLEQLTAQVERYLRKERDGIFRGREAIDEHRAIIAAYRVKDVALAQRLIREHVDHTRERAVEALDVPGTSILG